MATVFDHSKESFVESLGFDPKDFAELNSKLARTSQVMLIEQPQQSVLCEHIAKNFSYNELLLIATLFVVDKTVQIINDHPQLLGMIALREILKGD
jgi:hypothetical protein